LGVHGALRVPPDFLVLGDCGAFGYINEKVPPYSVEEVCDYYTAGGFTLGVSVDHLIPTADHPDRDLRYRITLENAQAFIREHRRRGLSWIPVGAVQGWDPESYAQAALATARMGYRVLALGGLVRASTQEIMAHSRSRFSECCPTARTCIFLDFPGSTAASLACFSGSVRR
jgi:hypothetical protein